MPSAPNTTRRERTEEKEGRRRHDNDNNMSVIFIDTDMHTPECLVGEYATPYSIVIVDHVRSYYNHDTTSNIMERISDCGPQLKRTPSSTVRKETGPSCFRIKGITIRMIRMVVILETAQSPHMRTRQCCCVNSCMKLFVYRIVPPTIEFKSREAILQLII
jgi:hypothetical protein